MSQQADIEAQSRPGTSFSLQFVLSTSSKTSLIRSSDDTSYLSNPYGPPEVNDTNRSAASWY